jgi:hypothetical protein
MTTPAPFGGCPPDDVKTMAESSTAWNVVELQVTVGTVNLSTTVAVAGEDAK